MATRKLNRFEIRLRKRGERSFPVLYFALCVIAFGILIPLLGFYWDDWPTIFYTHSHRIAQLINHFSYDRPFSVWAYYLIGRLGTAPIVWHIVALLQRWALIVAMAWALKPLWPRQVTKILYIALIFAIYPGYYVQPLSVIFAPHLAAYTFFFVSLGAMGRAVSQPQDFRKFTLLALAAAAAQMFTLEYYVGLELIRPLYIWFILQRVDGKAKRRLAKIARLWAPYAAILGAWVLWRLFLLKLPSEPYPFTFSHNPLAATGQFLQVAVKDGVYVLFITWSQTVQPALFNFATRTDWLAWGLALVTASGLGFVLFSYLRTSGRAAKSATDDAAFSRQGISLGFVAFVAGMLPIWAIGETIAQGDYNQRYILVAMFGASVLIVSLITYFVPIEKNRILIVAILVGLAVGNHFRQENEFRLDWQMQRNFYWQLFWRAPAIQSGTALISFDRLTHWTGQPLLGDALNTLYPPQAAAPNVDLWNFELTRTQTVERIRAGELLTNHYRGLLFSQSQPQNLFLYYMPEDGCLWVLDPRDVNNDYLPQENRGLAVFSNTSVISSDSTQSPDPTVFGAEPAHAWCYYFEKADLSAQLGDWSAVISEMNAAQQGNLSPNIGIEWLPLLQAYVMTGNFAAAQDLSLTIHRMHAKNDAMLCATWDQLAQNAALDSPAAQTAWDAVRQASGCQSN